MVEEFSPCPVPPCQAALPTNHGAQMYKASDTLAPFTVIVLDFLVLSLPSLVFPSCSISASTQLLTLSLFFFISGPYHLGLDNGILLCNWTENGGVPALPFVHYVSLNELSSVPSSDH